MLQRFALLILSAVLLLSAGLEARAGHCVAAALQAEAASEIAPAMPCHDMGAETHHAPAPQPDTPDSDSVCCCPAVLITLMAPPEFAPASIPIALARNLGPTQSLITRPTLPEPPPPRA